MNSQPSETVTYTYGGNGRTASVTDNRGTTSLAYEDGCDRVHSVTDPVTGGISYTYNNLGMRLTMTLPGGGTTHYYYGQNVGTDPEGGKDYILTKDDANALSMSVGEIVDDQGRIVYYDYDSNYPILLDSKFNQTFDNNGMLMSYCETDYTYDTPTNDPNHSHYWLKSLKTTWNSQDGRNNWTHSTLAKNAYTLDTTGQRLTNAITDNTGATRTEQYGYDELNRLTSVDYGDGETQGYGFDAMGNRLTKTDNITGNETSSFDNANRLVARGTNVYTNDAAGNTLTGGGRTNTWDSQNRLTQCVYGGNSSSYIYGADGMRHRSVVNGTSTDFVLDGDNVVREIRGGVNQATYFGSLYRRDDTTNTVRW